MRNFSPFLTTLKQRKPSYPSSKHTIGLEKPERKGIISNAWKLINIYVYNNNYLLIASNFILLIYSTMIKLNTMI